MATVNEVLSSIDDPKVRCRILQWAISKFMPEEEVNLFSKYRGNRQEGEDE